MTWRRGLLLGGGVLLLAIAAWGIFLRDTAADIKLEMGMTAAVDVENGRWVDADETGFADEQVMALRYRHGREAYFVQSVRNQGEEPVVVTGAEMFSQDDSMFVVDRVLVRDAFDPANHRWRPLRRERIKPEDQRELRFVGHFDNCDRWQPGDELEDAILILTVPGHDAPNVKLRSPVRITAPKRCPGRPPDDEVG